MTTRPTGDTMLSNKLIYCKPNMFAEAGRDAAALVVIDTCPMQAPAL
jgi:hypothetical protein